MQAGFVEDAPREGCPVMRKTDGKFHRAKQEVRSGALARAVCNHPRLCRRSIDDGCPYVREGGGISVARGREFDPLPLCMYLCKSLAHGGDDVDMGCDFL